MAAFQFCGRVCERGARTLAEPRGEPERAAFTEAALRAGFAAHQLRQPPADREPQAGAAVLAGGGAVGLLERA